MVFEVKIATQFLNIILKQVEIIQTAYIIRAVKLQKTQKFQENILLYFFCIQQLIINIYENIQDTSSALYSSDIKNMNLNVFNK